MYVKPHISLLTTLALICFSATASNTTGRLPEYEVAALKTIADTLGKNDWDFSVDPCSGASGWFDNLELGKEKYVACDCANNSAECHVTNITLKANDLQGRLPPEMAKLRYLVEIDLSRNYLSGPIPEEWGDLPLRHLFLLGNRFQGKIPPWIGNITTLEELALEANYFTGPIPPELGNLSKLRKIQLSSNMLTGELPMEFAKLTNMTDFRISDNRLSGGIPDFISKNWTKLNTLEIQASGIEGPIPPRIFRPLKHLNRLRITDMAGNMSSLELNDEITFMKELTLRNCGLSGELTDYIGSSRSYKYLDLSFNNLSGEIPSSSRGLENVTTEFVFLNRNNLSGPVPAWAVEKETFDLSYNKLTWNSTGDDSSPCQLGNVNLVGNLYKDIHLNKTTPCLGRIHCPRYYHSLYINCGGDSYKAYERDNYFAHASTFLLSQNKKWAFSNTGTFMDDPNDKNEKYTTNVNGDTKIQSMVDQELYKTARISPVSLTYFGLCLMNGSYTVKLHFAELIISNVNGFGSLGRRVFDIYIQGQLVERNFNIRDKANGSYIGITNQYNVTVTNNMLEVHLYWSGNGTQSLPTRGTYGPLISAISVDSNFDVGGFSTRIVIAIVVLGFCLITFIVIALWKKGCFEAKSMNKFDLEGLDLKMGIFTLRQIKLATNNFSDSNKIGEGGFGPVYKGVLRDGTVVAVKQLSSKSKQGNHEFLNELGMFSALQHPNLVKLYGCCIEGKQLLLLYEYMENNSLARALFGPKEFQLKLDWPVRKKICLGVAKGLAYLHEESGLKVVHRDIKATNVLLDKNLNPKISDFGLARLDEEENSHISTKIVGTIGYMAPEYATRGYLTEKADVYSFGILTLEIISGNGVMSYKRDSNMHLLDWVHVLKQKGNLKDLIDARLEMNFDMDEAMRMINVALVCVDPSPSCRPSMSAVVRMLKAESSIDIMSQRTLLFEGEATTNEHISYQSDMSRFLYDETILDITTSTSDLYPIIEDSQSSREKY